MAEQLEKLKESLLMKELELRNMQYYAGIVNAKVCRLTAEHIKLALELMELLDLKYKEKGIRELEIYANKT